MDGTNVDNWEIDELTQAVGEFVYYQNEQAQYAGQCKNINLLISFRTLGKLLWIRSAVR